MLEQMPTVNNMPHRPTRSSRLEKIVFWAAGIGVLISITVIVSYVITFGSQGLSSEQGKWAEFGEFVGGTIGPVIGFMTIVALISTLVVQRQQLLDSSDLLLRQSKLAGIQSFEQTLFSWLGTYRDLLDKVRGTELRKKPDGTWETKEIYGANALQYWWKTVFDTEEAWGAVEDEVFYTTGKRTRHHKPRIENLDDEGKQKAKKGFLDIWGTRIYEAHEPQLDGLFRTLFRLIDWIDRQSDDRVTPEQRFFYVSLVRAQLSKAELNFLFFNSLTDRGQKFKKFVERYALFDNLPVDRDSILMVCKASYEITSYSSDEARKALNLPLG